MSQPIVEPGGEAPSAPAPPPLHGPVPVVDSPASAVLAAAADWGPFGRVAFRLAFCYLLLFNLPFPIGLIPGLDPLAEAYFAPWRTGVPWVGTHLLGLPPITIFPNGSGDTTFNWVQLLCFAILTLGAAAAWTFLDRRRKAYPVLYDRLRTYLRFSIGTAMLSYGLSKVFKQQFPTPDVDRMIQLFGDASPMGLLWTFMGASTAYTFFAGAMEVAGGLLLFFRRTATVGALVVAGVMANVVMLNFCYDVPVKIYSTHLLLTAVFLLLPNLGRLADVLVFHRPTTPDVLGRPFVDPRKNRAAFAAKLVFLAGILLLMVNQRLAAHRRMSDAAPNPPFYGVYEVEELAPDGTVLPRLAGEKRLRTLVFNRAVGASIFWSDDSRERFAVQLDPAAHTLGLSERLIGTPAGDFTYRRPARGLLLLDGKLRDRPVRLRLRKVADRPFRLRDRGFHWVNEYPYNQ
jgi:uncharacterized membrane protein YphA (DoxX/SURF4 family)